MELSDMLHPMLELSISIPAIILCFLPMKNHLNGEKPSERQGKAPLAVGYSHSDFVVCRGGLALLAASL